MDSIVATAFLGFVIVCLGDPRNKIPRHLLPPLTGLGLFVVFSAFGLNAGISVNPINNIAGRLYFVFVCLCNCF
jgi:glycerol uptake facilitator-like aquaporin